jgi:hypothetical protein
VDFLIRITVFVNKKMLPKGTLLHHVEQAAPSNAKIEASFGVRQLAAAFWATTLPLKCGSKLPHSKEAKLSLR